MVLLEVLLCITMLSRMAIFGPVSALYYNCDAFRHYQFDRPPCRSCCSVLRSNNRLSSLSLRASYQSTSNNKKRSSLDPDIAAQFTIQVCTSTSCTRKLTDVGLDQYHVLGELYAQAEAVNLEQVMIIEDGGCQGGKNCKMGPCVAILHDEFDGNVALEGMNSNEFTERVCVSSSYKNAVSSCCCTPLITIYLHSNCFDLLCRFHNVLTDDDVTRVWGCMENAITLMAEEAKNDDNDDVDD